MKCKLFKEDDLEGINEFLKDNNNIEKILPISGYIAVFWYEPEVSQGEQVETSEEQKGYTKLLKGMK